MVAKKFGNSAASSASHTSAAPAIFSASFGAEPKRLMRGEKNAERKAKEKTAAEAEANAEDKMDKASTSSS